MGDVKCPARRDQPLAEKMENVKWKMDFVHLPLTIFHPPFTINQYSSS